MSGDVPPLVQGVEEGRDRIPDLLTEPSDCMQKPKPAQASAVTTDRHMSEPQFVQDTAQAWRRLDPCPQWGTVTSGHRSGMQ